MSDQQQSSSGVLAPMPLLDSHCLPSMADLLRRQGTTYLCSTSINLEVPNVVSIFSYILILSVGCAKLMESSNGNSVSEKASIFLDGSGKPMAVKQSSIAKALSILRDEEGATFCTDPESFCNLT